jgi:hypothetical protein
MAASRTTTPASLARTAPRGAWQIANSVAQLLSSDASGRGVWARETTPNVHYSTDFSTVMLTLEDLLGHSNIPRFGF